MLKKLLLLSLVCFCFSPAFAQGGKLIKAGADAARSGKVISEAISAQVARQVAQSQATAASVRLAQITNMPGTPVIKMQVDETLFPGQELTVRAISREKLHQTIYPGTGLKYLPESFNQKSPVLNIFRSPVQMQELLPFLNSGSF